MSKRELLTSSWVRNGDLENLRRLSAASGTMIRVTSDPPKTTGETENGGKFMGVRKRLLIHDK